MNNDIKEILDNLKYCKEHDKENNYYPEDILTREDVWLLLDCITNLQEENKKKEELIKKYDFELKHKTKQYEFLRHNESEELKKYKRYVDETFLYTYEELQDKVINLQEENQKLKIEINLLKELKGESNESKT